MAEKRANMTEEEKEEVKDNTAQIFVASSFALLEAIQFLLRNTYKHKGLNNNKVCKTFHVIKYTFSSR